MKSVTTERFRRAYEKLPEHIKDSTKKSYAKWKENPDHPSLQFKQIHKVQAIYSVRITLSYRAVGVRQRNLIIWFWIGSHAEYDKLIASL
jgi:mRNA-degrading endonuclease RelE of RelBE toxin-antitoxin system